MNVSAFPLDRFCIIALVQTPQGDLPARIYLILSLKLRYGSFRQTFRASVFVKRLWNTKNNAQTKGIGEQE